MSSVSDLSAVFRVPCLGRNVLLAISLHHVFVRATSTS